MAEYRLDVTSYDNHVPSVESPGTLTLPLLPEEFLMWHWSSLEEEESLLKELDLDPRSEKALRRGIEQRFALVWQYTLARARENQVESVLAYLKGIGFDHVAKEADEVLPGLWLLRLSEDRQHTPQSLRDRIMELSDFAAREGLELCEWKVKPRIHVPSLEEFLETALREYQFLTTEFGFGHPKSPALEHNPFSLEYRSKTTRVVVEGVHWGYGLEVEIHSVSSPRTSVPAIMVVAFRDREQVENVPEGQLELLRHSAQSLRNHASDLLRGDFTIVPAVRRFAARLEKQLSRF